MHIMITYKSLVLCGILSQTMAYTILNLPESTTEHSVPPVEVISLYKPEDNVVELIDDNITSAVYDSGKLWIIEFYAHWCGHCQKFKPVWIQAAKTFESKTKV